MAWVVTSIVMYVSLAVGALEIQTGGASRRETNYYGTGWNFVWFIVNLLLPWLSVFIMLVIMGSIDRSYVFV